MLHLQRSNLHVSGVGSQLRARFGLKDRQELSLGFATGLTLYVSQYAQVACLLRGILGWALFRRRDVTGQRQKYSVI